REDDLVKMYNDAAILAITSHYEGEPRVTFEAGACHTQFVSTPVGILAEAARDGVHGFFAKKTQVIAERMIEMIQDLGLREIGKEF
ncbi:MAG: hypothetical protein DRN59_03430, partial [Thaumarchaeota archaeon]